MLQGTGRKARLNRNEPKPPPIAPEMPAWLAPEAKREWERVAPVLERLGLLTALDRAALAIYCQAWARYVDAEAQIAKDGALVPGHRGVMRKHPLLLVLNAAVATLKAFGAEFGMSPASRGRLDVGGADADEPECPKCGLPNTGVNAICGCRQARARLPEGE